MCLGSPTVSPLNYLVLLSTKGLYITNRGTNRGAGQILMITIRKSNKVLINLNSPLNQGCFSHRKPGTIDVPIRARSFNREN
jgi:hypothetical protein